MLENPSPDGQPLHPDVRHENSDANVSRIVLVGVIMGLLAVIIHVAVAWQFDLYRAREDRQQPRLSPLAAKERPQFPRDINKIPPPRLEQADRIELDRLRQTEEELLNGPAGWVDPKAGTVRIPIEEAMRILS